MDNGGLDVIFSPAVDDTPDVIPSDENVALLVTSSVTSIVVANGNDVSFGDTVVSYSVTASWVTGEVTEICSFGICVGIRVKSIISPSFCVDTVEYNTGDGVVSINPEPISVVNFTVCFVTSEVFISSFGALVVYLMDVP